jgi:Mlc titration factor MtfA (ptsG expression regulator)
MIKFFLPLALFCAVIYLTYKEQFEVAVPLFFLMFIFLIFFVIIGKDDLEEEVSEEAVPAAGSIPKTPSLTYYGDELNFSNEELTTILTKHFPYYNTLTADEQQRFLLRLQNFLQIKTFKIHDKQGFKEMPVLISAAAIQLTFGLDKYLLPHFEFIHVYPEEFMRVQPAICFLEGNVSGHSINLSWKHFMQGYSNGNDGQNVGLHELAHALYYQTFEVEENVDSGFRDMYSNYVKDSNKVYHTELNNIGGLYSDYAIKNLQEFWAESAELFFEKPNELKSFYPQLYQTMIYLLNQDPLNKISTVA